MPEANIITRQPCASAFSLAAGFPWFIVSNHSLFSLPEKKIMYKRDWRLYSKPINGIRKIKTSRSRDKRVMRLYGRKLLNGCNDPARFGGHRYCGSGDNMFLIYYVTSRDHVFKGLCDLMG